MNSTEKEGIVLSIIIEDRNKLITDLLNGTYLSLKTIMPFHHEMKKPQLLKQSLHLQFGVLIGMTIDIKGKLILAGDSTLFSSIGQSMYGIPLEGDMLISFSGELGNMIAGGLSTHLIGCGIKTDITSPTIIQGNTILSGHQQALQMTAVFEKKEEMDIYLLLD